MNMKFNQLKRFLRTGKTKVTKIQDLSDTRTLTAIKDSIKKHTKQGLFNQGMLAEFNSGEKKFKKLSETATKIVDNAEFLDVDGLVQQVNSVQISQEGLQRGQEELSRLHDSKEKLLQENMDCTNWMSELAQENQILERQLKELMEAVTKTKEKIAKNESQITQLNDRSNYAEIDIVSCDNEIKDLTKVVKKNLNNFVQGVDQLELNIRRREIAELEFNIEDKKNLVRPSKPAPSRSAPSRPAPLPPVEIEGQNMPNLGTNSSNTLSEVSLGNTQNQSQKR